MVYDLVFLWVADKAAQDIININSILGAEMLIKSVSEPILQELVPTTL